MRFFNFGLPTKERLERKIDLHINTQAGVIADYIELVHANGEEPPYHELIGPCPPTWPEEVYMRKIGEAAVAKSHLPLYYEHDLSLLESLAPGDTPDEPYVFKNSLHIVIVAAKKLDVTDPLEAIYGSFFNPPGRLG